MKQKMISFAILLILSTCLLLSVCCESYFSKRIWVEQNTTSCVHLIILDYLSKNIQSIDSNAADSGKWVYSDTLGCYIRDVDMYFLKDEIDSHDMRFDFEALGKPDRILMVSHVYDHHVATFGDGSQSWVKDWSDLVGFTEKPFVSIERRSLLTYEIRARDSKNVFSLLLFLFIIFIGIRKLYTAIEKKLKASNLLCRKA